MAFAITRRSKMRRINSENDAWAYFNDEYGLPEYFSSFDELSDVEDELEALKKEKESVDYAIKHRDPKFMAEFTVNRAIELHFLITVGERYLEECKEETTAVEKDNEGAYEYGKDCVEEYYKDTYDEDDLFPRDFER